MWSSLYCVLSSSDSTSPEISNKPSITDWFRRIKDNELVRVCIPHSSIISGQSANLLRKLLFQTRLLEWSTESSTEILKTLAESSRFLSPNKIDKNRSVIVNDVSEL